MEPYYDSDGITIYNGDIEERSCKIAAARFVQGMLPMEMFDT